MNAQHRARRGTSPAADFATDHTFGVAAAGVVVVAAVVALVAFYALTGGPTTPVAPATASAPIARLETPAARAYLGTLYADATIGPKDLTADNVLKLGEHVCDGLHAGDSLAKSYAYVRDVTRLDKMQAARLVDAADRNLCRERK